MTPSAVSTGSNLESVFLANLALIDRLIALIARRHALSASDAEEFGAWAHEKIIDCDYAVIRKFGGRSSLSTYLTTVLVNLFRDYRNARWGRWRPSAEAKRRGPIGIRLEELIYRDGHSLREAVQILQALGAPLSDTDVFQLAAALPVRRGHSEVSIESAQATLISVHPGSEHDAEDMLVLEKLLHSLVASLPAEDALIMRMRYWSEMSVAEIARTLRVEQKPLYRRLEGIQANLRAALESRGVDRTRAIEIVTDATAR